MQRNSMTVYTKYRRLMFLLLIFPIYKFIEALVEQDYAIAIAMIIALATAICAILYLELKLKAASPPSPTKQPRAN